MSDPTLPLRRHDLPPAWDGTPITWDHTGHDIGPVFLCPPPKPSRCAGCRDFHAAPADTWRGRGPEDIGATLVHLSRAPCGHDTVVDLTDGTVWELDDTD